MSAVFRHQQIQHFALVWSAAVTASK